jgi:hypothetical protein
LKLPVNLKYSNSSEGSIFIEFPGVSSVTCIEQTKVPYHSRKENKRIYECLPSSKPNGIVFRIVSARCKEDEKRNMHMKHNKRHTINQLQ